MEILEHLERKLQNPKNRYDLKVLQELLHEDFEEIGYSWNTHTRESTIASLTQEITWESSIHSQEYEFHLLSNELSQVIYKSVEKWANWEYTRYTKRMSLWIQENNTWKLRYHQATPTEQFEIIL